MIKELEINDIHVGICWAPDKDYLYDVRLNMGKVGLVSRFTPLTGWKWEGNNRSWFIKGFRVSAQEFFDQLTDEEKEKAIWEINEWK